MTLGGELHVAMQPAAGSRWVVSHGIHQDGALMNGNYGWRVRDRRRYGMTCTIRYYTRQSIPRVTLDMNLKIHGHSA